MEAVSGPTTGTGEIALKVDVDTHQGLRDGVPRLLRALAGAGVAATFFIAMGPDNSGRAIMRALRNPGFIRKMRRTRAVAMYGLRTVLSGTLLPARPIARAFPGLLRELVREGFEVGVHGYDHVRWQDQLDRLGRIGLAAELDEAFALFEEIVGTRALAFAAPGWRTSATALALLEPRELAYRSDTRGDGPFRCINADRVLTTVEIPTTWPTMDELLGAPGLADAASVVTYYLTRYNPCGLNVHTIHAETEGLSQLDALIRLVTSLRERGARFVQLREVAARLDPARLPVCEVVRATLPGRAGWISAQGPARAAPLPRS